MNEIIRSFDNAIEIPGPTPINVSRRGVLTGLAGSGLVLKFGIPVGEARAQAAAPAMAPGTRVPAFLEIKPDNTVHFMCPFVEGGQGPFTALAQIVGEELDMDPATFTVENAPPGPDYLVVNGKMRITGGSMSVRSSYTTMRKLGAAARQMILQAAATKLNVPVAELTTEPGVVIHAASNQKINYGEVAADAAALPVPSPDSLKLKDPSTFRWIKKPIPRLDVYIKSTGKAMYGIDAKVDGMLHAAVQHAPRLGQTVAAIRNEADVKAMKGVTSIHKLQGAVAVVAERFWVAKRAAEALQVVWGEAVPDPKAAHVMPADFSTAAFAARLANEKGDGQEAEKDGDAPGYLAKAKSVISATYHSQYVHHAQLEPPSTLARFNADGTLELWMPNQCPELYQADIAKITGLDASKIIIHSPILGGFFGRHFLYPAASPYPQVIQLAKETGKPIKLIWTREEEFLRDPLRPMAAVRFRAALDDNGMPAALEAISATEGPSESINGHTDKMDSAALEGLAGKAYKIPNKRIAQIYVQNPTVLGYWRSVGNSMNDFLYETFLDEVADAGKKDPYELRLKLLEGNDRLTTLLKAVGDLSGGWKRGPFTAEDGTRRARGVGMASPFGTQAAAIAEVSIKDGLVVVHDVWEMMDPGSMVNPGIIESQVNSATALGTSQVLLEEAVYENGVPVARNYDLYPILPPDRMPKVHVKIIESGAEMGGIGETGLPAVPPAIANAVSTLTGQRIRSMPLSQYKFTV